MARETVLLDRATTLIAAAGLRGEGDFGRLGVFQQRLTWVAA
jgi:hypothetical protein